MPCDSIIQSSVEFLPTSTDVKLLADALTALGYEVSSYQTTIRFSEFGRSGSYETATGKLTMPTDWDSAAVKKAYSKEIVNSQAKRFGWKVTWKKDDEGNETADVEKRRF